PRLALSLRQGADRDAERLRLQWREADAPRAARLAGVGVPPLRRECQTSAPAHRLVGHLPAIVALRRQGGGGRRRQSAAVALPATAAGGRGGPRRHAGGLGGAELLDGWTEFSA